VLRACTNAYLHLLMPTTRSQTMVAVEEVRDSSLPQEHESDYETDSDVLSVSDVSDDDNIANETYTDRLIALKDIVAPSTRLEAVRKWQQATSWVSTGSQWAGNAVWIITTSALLVGLPLALAIEDEARIVGQEKELQMQQSGQQSVSRVSFQSGGIELEH
jgi:import receptor subunit TOM22